jgi:hypothetical protein
MSSRRGRRPRRRPVFSLPPLELSELDLLADLDSGMLGGWEAP